jgi:hypothetical protein
MVGPKTSAELRQFTGNHAVTDELETTIVTDRTACKSICNIIHLTFAMPILIFFKRVVSYE